MIEYPYKSLNSVVMRIDLRQKMSITPSCGDYFYRCGSTSSHAALMCNNWHITGHMRWFLTFITYDCISGLLINPQSLQSCGSSHLQQNLDKFIMMSRWQLGRQAIRRLFPPPAKPSIISQNSTSGAYRFITNPAGFCFRRHLESRFYNFIPPSSAAKVPQGQRFYHVDAQGYQHFRGRGFGGKDRSKLYAQILVVVGGLCTIVYVSNQEIVPYTYRKHFVLVSPEMEAMLVDKQFDALKKQWKSLILSPVHPDSVRVRKISQDIIKAVMEGTRLDDDSHLTEDKVQWEGHQDSKVWGEIPASEQWGSRDEILDEKSIVESRKKGLNNKAKPYVEHLKPAKWEVLVVEKNEANAFCLPGGKIVVFTGLLKHFPSDAEIATALGHEVAHVVARHSAERLTRHLFLTIAELFVLAFFYAPDLVRSAATLFLELPFSRSQELEADHIGLLLMAAAGYDPRVAPLVYEKLGKLSGSSEFLQYVTTHPSGSKRGERLRRTGTMEQAVDIYIEKTQGKTIEGFL